MTDAQAIRTGEVILGIELGSTRIKARVIGRDHRPLASGTYEWSSQLVDGNWTYELDDVWAGIQHCYAALIADMRARFGVVPSQFDAIGVSGMMHGYLAFDTERALLTPFRTWRNTNATEASDALTELFDHHVPRRWSISHLYQCMLDGEAHVGRVDALTTLAGYVHWCLTGERVLGIGDASGMFPIDPHTRGWDAGKMHSFDALVSDKYPQFHLGDVLPHPLVAGADAGRLTTTGAALLDPSGHLQPGAPMCAPEGDAATGMVATNSVAVRTGNISAGTSVFAMVVLEGPLSRLYREIDLVATPAGDPVAMVHGNNGASELAAWVAIFSRFAELLGAQVDRDAVFGTLLAQAMAGDPDAGGIVAYNFHAGEPLVGVAEGRPLMVRPPHSDLSLTNFMRAQVYSIFATVSIGLNLLVADGVAIDKMYAHGGLFRTEGVAQQLLAAAIDTPVGLSEIASEGGSWGIAVLAAYRRAVSEGYDDSLNRYLDSRVFDSDDSIVVEPDISDVSGFARFIERYRIGLGAVNAAAGLRD